tara:strand:+ start:246 stop:494 length:249 start_codon:yes stop_codon:yes gene_type:complete
MCIFGQKQKTTPGAPPVMPTQPTDTSLPEAQVTKDPEEVTGIQYGSSKKDTGSAAAKRTGTDALSINLNQPTAGSESGGLNV